MDSPVKPANDNKVKRLNDKSPEGLYCFGVDDRTRTDDLQGHNLAL